MSKHNVKKNITFLIIDIILLSLSNTECEEKKCKNRKENLKTRKAVCQSDIRTRDLVNTNTAS